MNLKPDNRLVLHHTTFRPCLTYLSAFSPHDSRITSLTNTFHEHEHGLFLRTRFTNTAFTRHVFSESRSMNHSLHEHAHVTRTRSLSRDTTNAPLCQIQRQLPMIPLFRFKGLLSDQTQDPPATSLWSFLKKPASTAQRH